MLSALLMFAIGSALTGSARSMSIVILGRSIQGIGAGGISTSAQIVIVDLVPLAERGAFFGILASVWAIASVIGPPVGGALASAGAWRWLFYLNLPLSAIAILLVALFLQIKAPETTMQEKLEQMDYVNLIFVGGATSTILGLTWGGVTYPWGSYQVLVPLILRFIAMGVYLWLEKVYVKYPTVPFDIIVHRTSLLGLLTTFLHGIVTLAAIYYLTIYFQASKGASAKDAGVDLFSLSFSIAPFAIMTGISIGFLGTYKLHNIFGWCLAAIGFGLTSLLKWDSSRALWAGYSLVMGIGLGILYSSVNFPVLSPLKPSQQPHAIVFFGFMRSFGQVFGIAIGATTLQNELARNLPEQFLAQLHGDAEIAYSVIPVITTLSEPLRTEVRAAFAQSLTTIWIVMLGISGLGLISALFIRNIALTKETDDKWGLKEHKRKKGPNDEKGGVTIGNGASDSLYDSSSVLIVRT